MRITQFITEERERKVGLVRDDRIVALEDVDSTYELALLALSADQSIESLVDSKLGDVWDVLEDVIADGRMLSPLDHPDRARLWITGTGLTHVGSARSRDQMHTSLLAAEGQTDTMRMFEMGLRGGKPERGEVGVQPEWFYKGNGTCVVRPEAAITSPAFALLDGEEIEVCVLYIIAQDGTPFRIGFALGNEFSDHLTEKENYLYLAHSKLRPCSFGPELLLGALPQVVSGTSRILRNGNVLWSRPFLSGEQNMSHSIANLEHHLFKYPLFRNPGDLHVHFLGTTTVSFADAIEPEPGDVFEMTADCFGAPLRNVLERGTELSVEIRSLYREGI